MPPNTDGLLVVGAYPNNEAYEKIREGIDEINEERQTGFAYPVTTEVHIPKDTHESKKAFWTIEESPTGPFILAFARWTGDERNRTAHDAKKAFDKAIPDKDTPLERKRCGLVKGGLWDIYCFLQPTDNFPADVSDQSLLFKALWEKLKGDQVEGVVFKICSELPSS